MVRLAQARFDDATADFESALGAARGTGAAAAERAALAGLCDALFYAQRVEEMAARARELLEVATRAGAAGDTAEARARIGQAFVGQGQFEEAVPLLDDAIEAARRVGAPVALKIALSYRGLVHYWQTEYQAAEITSVEALSLARLGDGFYALAARMFLGLARVHLGRISEALDDFADAISVARRNDDRYWLPRLVSHLGWAHRELGALDRAREHDTEAVRLARERPAWGPESEVLLNLCVDDVREGRAEQASAMLLELQAPWAELLDALAERDPARLRLGRALGGARRPRAHPRAFGPAGGDGGTPRGARLPLHRRADPDRSRARARRGHRKRGPGPGRGPRRAAAPDPPRSKPGSRRGFSRSRGGGSATKRALARPSPRRPARSETIAAGTRDEGLRKGFLAMPLVREVLDAVPGEGPALTG